MFRRWSSFTGVFLSFPCDGTGKRNCPCLGLRQTERLCMGICDLRSREQDPSGHRSWTASKLPSKWRWLLRTALTAAQKHHAMHHCLSSCLPIGLHACRAICTSPTLQCEHSDEETDFSIPGIPEGFYINNFINSVLAKSTLLRHFFLSFTVYFTCQARYSLLFMLY